MHRPLKFATLIAVALTFTACADSPQHSITEPGGLPFAKVDAAPIDNLSAGHVALYTDIKSLGAIVYACASAKLQDNKSNDIEKMATYANAGRWDQATYGQTSVEYMANKLIGTTQSLIVAGKINTGCAGWGGGNLSELADEFYFLISAFAGNAAEYDNGTYVSFTCPDGGCTRTGNGWKVDVPEDAFDGPRQFVVRPNNGNFPSEDYETVGNSFHFDVFPSGLANSPWTRWICVGEGVDVPESWIVMVRETEEGLDFLETTFEDWENTADCTPLNQSAFGRALRGASRVLAGFPLFPRDLHAYSPPRTFGGTSTAASPHWLTVIEPAGEGHTLLTLRALAVEYYGDANPNTNAALGHLDAAIACSEGDTECVNSSLKSFTKVVAAQTGPNKVLTEAEGTELISIALSLMQ